MSQKNDIKEIKELLNEIHLLLSKDPQEDAKAVQEAREKELVEAMEA